MRSVCVPRRQSQASRLQQAWSSSILLARLGAGVKAKPRRYLAGTFSDGGGGMVALLSYSSMSSFVISMLADA